MSDLLHQEQGTLNSNIIYLHELALIKKSASFADIAHDINFDLILCFFCILQRVAVAHVHADFMLGTIFQIMKNVYIGKETEWLKDVNNFREERLPWTPFEGPISWSKVRHVLDQYKIDLKNRQIIIIEPLTYKFTPDLFMNCWKLGIPTTSDPKAKIRPPNCLFHWCCNTCD